MAAEDAFFAVPPDSEPAPVGDAPIILGAPTPEDETPAFVGDVDEAPAAVTDETATSTDPSPMQEWNAAWQTTLSQRKDEENACKVEMVEAARVALEKFQAEREEKRQAKMGTNRSDEQAKLEAIEADLENDNSWQRVCKMVDMSHDNKAAAEDVKRMRDVMILLKNEPARATALST